MSNLDEFKILSKKYLNEYSDLNEEFIRKRAIPKGVYLCMLFANLTSYILTVADNEEEFDELCTIFVQESKIILNDLKSKGFWGEKK
jgi:hypothetical protein